GTAFVIFIWVFGAKSPLAGVPYGFCMSVTMHGYLCSLYPTYNSHQYDCKDGGFGGSFKISLLLSSNDICLTTSKMYLFSIDKGRCLSAGFGSTQKVVEAIRSHQNQYFLSAAWGFELANSRSSLADPPTKNQRERAMRLASQTLSSTGKNVLGVPSYSNYVVPLMTVVAYFQVSGVRTKNRGKIASLNINFLFTSLEYYLLIVFVILIEQLILLLKVR
ncbi:MAG: hypothetical protein EZS28_053921, partial [Streblomastix strix]